MATAEFSIDAWILGKLKMRPSIMLPIFGGAKGSICRQFLMRGEIKQKLEMVAKKTFFLMRTRGKVRGKKRNAQAKIDYKLKVAI